MAVDQQYETFKSQFRRGWRDAHSFDLILSVMRVSFSILHQYRLLNIIHITNLEGATGMAWLDKSMGGQEIEYNAVPHYFNKEVYKYAKHALSNRVASENQHRLIRFIIHAYDYYRTIRPLQDIVAERKQHYITVEQLHAHQSILKGNLENARYWETRGNDQIKIVRLLVVPCTSVR